MGRFRTNQYLDIYLSQGDLRKLKKGYLVSKLSQGQKISVHLENKDRKTQREIDKLKAKISILEASKRK